MLKLHSPKNYPNLLLYVLDETHITVTLTTALAILYTHNAHIAWMALGALGSSLTAKLLKKQIKGPRPPPPSDSVPSPMRPKKTYGMPSTHSTALSFYFFYILPVIISPASAHHLPYPKLTGAAVTVYWSAGLWSRKELGYHTWRQIIAGVFTGAVLAGVWRGIWQVYGVGQVVQPVMDRIWKNIIG